MSISEELVYRIIHEVLRPLGIAYVRAPGEADGQMAMMCSTGAVDFVDSDDGDLVVHGVPVLYTKVNYSTGLCYRYCADDWNQTQAPAQVEADVVTELRCLSESKHVPLPLEREAPLRDACVAAGVNILKPQKPLTLALLRALWANDDRFTSVSKKPPKLNRDALVATMLSIVVGTPLETSVDQKQPHSLFGPLSNLVHLRGVSSFSLRVCVVCSVSLFLSLSLCVCGCV